MTPGEIKEYFSNGYKFSRETGMAIQSFHNWLKWGYVPLNSQLKIQTITDGKLKADFKDIPRGDND